MSVTGAVRRMTVPKVAARKGGEPLVVLTAYDVRTAGIVDGHADVILVGDSLGMVAHGLDSTVPVTLEQMILHGAAVVRGSRRALVVVDMPFGSYEESPQWAYRSAAKILKRTGCAAVKLEGGARMAETIRFLTQRGIPVMAHTGLTPQSSNTMGGFRTQGRDRESWAAHEADAVAVQEAGAFSIVLEGMVEPLAAQITEQLDIPTIGIGASGKCDGQVLVLEDMLGLSERVPRFVKKYADLASVIDGAVEKFARDVRSREFPGPEHVYEADD